MRYWIMKSEPTTYGINHLASLENQEDSWEGVRNYQARNFMKSMKKGDQAFFYHSACKEPGIVGLMEVSQEAYPDFTAFDATSKYYDPRSTTEKPIWEMVSVRLLEAYPSILSLKTLKEHASMLEGLEVLKRGSRLSVSPVSEAHHQTILDLLAKHAHAPT